MAARERVSGEPASGNGASSFHLIWEMPQLPLLEVSATVEILAPPAVRRLYFWALQVSFAGERRLQGGAHIGLQWNPRHPGSTAVNWGGYDSADAGSQLLSGSESTLPSSRSDPNTRDFRWSPGHRYRLRVAPAGEGPDGLSAWRGTVTNLESGERVTVRDLYSRGRFLVAPMVWSEVFARCEQPSVTARWSALQAITSTGEEMHPQRVRVNYQGRRDGGCDNTTVSSDELGILQTTAAQRQVPQGAILPVAGLTEI